MSEQGPAAPAVYIAFCPRCKFEMEMRRFREKETLDAMITGYTYDWWCRNCKDRLKKIKIDLLEESK